MTTNRRGQGTIYRRGNVWWVVFWFRGTRHRESSGSTRRADALKLLRRRLGEMGTGRLVGPEPERTTFDDLATMLLDDYAMNGRPLRRLRGALAHLRGRFAFFRALDITTDRLTAYVRERQEEGAAAATIKQEMALLRRAFNLALKAGRLVWKPAFPTITVNNTRTGFFEREDFEAVRAELPEPLRPVVTFAYLTGWRRSEILGLRWRDVDFTAGLVRLEPGTTKNREGRAFPFAMLPELATLLRSQREATTVVERRTGELIPWVFHHRNGAPIKSFDHAWRTAIRRAATEERDGVRVITRPQLLGRIVHDFRRTAVRNLVRAAVGERVAMKLVGHKTRSIFDRYNIVNESDLAEGVAKLAAMANRHKTATVSGY